MAIDLNKEISFGKGGGAGRGAKSYPTKTSMNLMSAEVKKTAPTKTILLGVLGAVVLAAFLWFGVATQLMAVNGKQAELDGVQAQVSALEGQLGDYDKVLQRYQSYTGLLETAGDIPDARSVVDMIVDTVDAQKNITNITMAGTTVTLNLKDTTFTDAGKLAERLKGKKMVSDAVVASASKKNSGGDIASIIVTLVGGDDEQ